jgi:molybdopterin synthase catalytic subunit
MNEVRVLFFATLKDLTGTQEIVVEVERGTEVKELKAILVSLFPSINETINHVLIAVNREFAFDEDIIPEGAEVGVFPPVSGGVDGATLDLIVISETEVDISEVVSKITLPTTGAVCSFTGTVRVRTLTDNPHETSYLEYEAYKPMAERKMHQVVDEIRNKWPKVEGIAIIQRIGHLGPGTPTVLIACSSAHRDDGVFEASRYGIDRLKEIVPIWKKEVDPDGEEWVEGGYIPTREDISND